MAYFKYDKSSKKAIIQFTDRDGKRRTVSAAKISKTAAARLVTHVEALNEARRTSGSVPGETLSYLKDLGVHLYDKLVRIGLVEPRAETKTDDNASKTLGVWLVEYISKRSDVKGATLVFYGHTKRNLEVFFGKSKPLRDVTTGDAEDFCRYLQKQKLAKATIARRFSMARTFFRAAMKHRLIDVNPFTDAEVSTTARANRDRQQFITPEEIAEVLRWCPDYEWRLLVVLARFGGLRVPSEALTLKWSNVDWEKEEILVHAPKTEHHEDKATRVIPIFPELRPFLEEAQGLAGQSEFVIQKHRSQAERTDTGWAAVNLRTRFLKIIRRAGLEPWPKPWQNLRASRETELRERFPDHVCTYWIGNSKRVAEEHYYMVTKDHIKKALDKDCNALHSALHYGVESSGTESTSKDSETEEPPGNSKKEAVSGENPKPLDWAMRDSNPRHPRCKRGALAN
jgi:integrase